MEDLRFEHEDAAMLAALRDAGLQRSRPLFAIDENTAPASVEANGRVFIYEVINTVTGARCDIILDRRPIGWIHFFAAPLGTLRDRPYLALQYHPPHEGVTLKHFHIRQVELQNGRLVLNDNRNAEGVRGHYFFDKSM